MSAGRWRVSPWIIAAIAYASVALVLTWPLAPNLSRAVAHDAGDPLLNATILWWNATVPPLSAGWWNFPIFWPATGALALSEHLLGLSMVATPLQWLGASPVGAYNLLVLLSFPLAALSAHALAYALTRRHDAASVAGVLFGFSPYRTSQLAHVQVLWSLWLPIALLALHRYGETGRRRWIVLFGVAWLMASASNGYFIFYFGVLVAAWITWFLFRRGRWTRAAAAVVTWTLASLPLVPLLSMYQRVQGRLGLVRDLSEVKLFSAQLESILAVSSDAWLGHGRQLPEGQLYPGFAALTLPAAALGIALWQRRSVSDEPRWRFVHHLAIAVAVICAAAALSIAIVGPWSIGLRGLTLLSVDDASKALTASVAALVIAVASSAIARDAWRRSSPLAFYTAAAALMFTMALGPQPATHDRELLHYGPYWLLMQLPGVSALRAPGRFGTLLTLCIATASAAAFARLTRASHIAVVAAGAAIGATLVEAWIPVMPLGTLPGPIPALAAETARDSTPVVEVPLGAVYGDVAAVARLPFHRRPVVNGYSGYVPPHYDVLRIGLTLGDADVLTELARAAPILVVVDRRDHEWSTSLAANGGLLTAQDQHSRVYRISARDAPADSSDPPLPIASVSSNVGVELVPRMTDGDLRTEWNTRRTQSGGEEIVIDLGRNRFVSEVVTSLGPFRVDFPRRLAVDCAPDGGEWQRCWEGSTTAIALRATLDDPSNPVLRVPVRSGTVRRVRLRQTAVDPRNGWSIAELGVLGR